MDLVRLIDAVGEPDASSIWRYAAGAQIGAGGILAAGCTIGAGSTGGSVLAASSLLGLLSMIAGASLADRLVDRAPAQHGPGHATAPTRRRSLPGRRRAAVSARPTGPV